MPKKYICIHGHFYQPPRENPWLEEIEQQESAYPYHDWNERITRECYAPNAASRILDGDNKITEIINNYKRISFNFGPTLLTWLERKAPGTYQAILRADAESRDRFSGHGPAIAQCYNHMIMPLANARDQRTQIRWGLRDFEFRFGRKPEGMWLPETAVDTGTLEMLAEEGIAFTILAQRQCKAVRKIGHKKWKETPEGSVDPHRAYLYPLPSGRQITVFFYDGAVAHDVSFGNLLANGENFAKRLLGTDKNPEEPAADKDPAQLVHIATDGETYGHHHGMGDMALAYCLNSIDKDELADLTVYGEFLKKYPPQYEAQIFENSSWSCVHGVERWRADCGCHIGGSEGWTQQWRKPLRETLDWLRDRLSEIYEKEAAAFFSDVWAARERYIDVILDRSQENVENFLSRETGRFLSTDDMVKTLKLLEMQRHAMLMYTSCGWFFDELSGIETVQILRYAARAMQMAAEAAGVSLEEEFLQRLTETPSNIPELKNGAGVYEKFVRPSILTLMRVGAHHAMSALFEKQPESIEIYSYTLNIERFERLESDRNRFVGGILRIRSKITTEEKRLSFAVLHSGDENLLAGASIVEDEKDFSRLLPDLKNVFKKGDTAAVARMIEENFENRYSIKDLLRDEQSRILYSILDSNLEEIEVSLREINHHRGPVVRVLKELRVPLPKVLGHTISLMFAKDLLDALSSDKPDLERLKKLIGEVREFTLEIDKETISFVVRQKVDGLMDAVYHNNTDSAVLERTAEFLETVAPLQLQFDLWKAQNTFFEVRDKVYQNIQSRAASGDAQARRWLDEFKRLGEGLKVKV
jgi:alpha-amylase/alpha-mannosidase (GH57 family)